MVALVVLMAVGVRVRGRSERQTDALPEDGDADEHDEGGGHEVEPGIQLLRNDQSRERERHEPEREDADRVRHGDDPSEEKRVARAAAGADEVRRDDGLAVPGPERVGGAPEEGGEERDEHDARSQVALLDEPREAAARRVRPRLGGRCERRRDPTVTRPDAGLRDPDVQRAREPRARVGAEAVADAACGHGRPGDARAALGADDELPPPEPIREDAVPDAHRVLGATGDDASREHELEARRPQAGRPGEEREPPLDGRQRTPPAVDRDRQSRGDRPREPAGVAVIAERPRLVPRLEGGDLGEIEDVRDVRAVSRDDDLRVLVRREVAQRVGRRHAGRAERGDDCHEEDGDPLHACPSRPAGDRFGVARRAATGAQRTEKLGSSRRARRYHAPICARSPAHPAA
jgi:hypothetical protein